MRSKYTDGQRMFRIYKLDASYLIEHWRDGTGMSLDYYDLNKIVIRRELLKDMTIQYQGNALLDVLPEVKDAEYRDITVNSMVILDFSDCNLSTIKGQRKDNCNALFKDGFNMLLAYENSPRHYVQFDKSASMAREQQITFIDDTLFEYLDNRNDLGIDFSKIENTVIRSKYFAYRGLCLTSGDRIPDSVIELNEKTVCVIDFKSAQYGNQDNVRFVTYDINDDELEKKVTSGGNIEITKFDGEGIISPKYAEQINDYLYYNTGENASSFQVRMPFVKGMLHKVDFHDFIIEKWKEYTGEKTIDSGHLKIRDAFGIERSFSDIQIILSASMFKCKKWLENYPDAGDDPMAFYFEQLRKYEHALYITQTDLDLSNDRKINMNYQFFNTLKLGHDDFCRIVKNCFDDTLKIHIDPDAAKKQLFHKEAEEEEYADTITTQNEDSWKYVLKYNNAAINNKFIRSRLDDQEKSIAKNAARGRILVPGKQFYLSGDLLELLYDILQDSSYDDRHFTKENIEKKIHNACIGNSSFYSNGFPVAEGISECFSMSPEKAEKEYPDAEDRVTQYYGVFRNPHLSRNEECALAAYNAGPGNVGPDGEGNVKW